MRPETIRALIELSAVIVQHIWKAVQNNDEKELRRLSDVWPKHIKDKIALLRAEERTRNIAKKIK